MCVFTEVTVYQTELAVRKKHLSHTHTQQHWDAESEMLQQDECSDIVSQRSKR